MLRSVIKSIITGKVIHQQTAIIYKLLDINTPPFCRYKPEPVLESANIILYWDRSIMTDKTVDFSRSDVVFVDGENKTALVTDIAVPWTHNLSYTEAEEFAEHENLALEI